MVIIVLCTLVRLLETAVFCVMLNRILQKRFEMRLHSAAVFLCMFALQTAGGMLNELPIGLNLIVNIILDLLVIQLFYRDDIYRAVLHTFVFYSLLFICDLIGYFAGALMGILVSEPIEHLEIIPYWIIVVSRVPLPFCIHLYLRIVKCSNYLKTRQKAAIFIPVFFSTLIVIFNPWGTSRNLYHKSPLIFYIVSLSMVAAVIYLVISLNKHKFRESGYREKLKHQGYSEEYYRDLSWENNRLRGVYHDFANIIDYLESTGGSQSDVASARKRLERPSYHTGNMGIDIILHIKRKAFEEQGISIQASGYIAEDTGWLNPIDLCIILGNALDNAQEATSRQEPKQRSPIQVRFSHKGGIFLIVVENSVSPDMGTSFKSTKKGRCHGYGLQNIKKAASGYGGHVDIAAKDGRVTLSVLLQRPPL